MVVANGFSSDPITPQPCDFDYDGDVDQSDFGQLQVCLNGSNVTQTMPQCLAMRLDADTDVDADDVTLFLQCESGPTYQQIPAASIEMPPGRAKIARFIVESANAFSAT